MGKPYCSFLVRCWLLGSEERRIEVEHIQTGHRRPFDSIQAAVEWISVCCAESADEQTKTPERPIRPDQPT